LDDKCVVKVKKGKGKKKKKKKGKQTKENQNPNLPTVKEKVEPPQSLFTPSDSSPNLFFSPSCLTPSYSKGYQHSFLPIDTPSLTHEPVGCSSSLIFVLWGFVFVVFFY
jgi:hypothetical protein